jgi:hypothetical protein
MFDKLQRRINGEAVSPRFFVPEAENGPHIRTQDFCLLQISNTILGNQYGGQNTTPMQCRVYSAPSHRPPRFLFFRFFLFPVSNIPFARQTNGTSHYKHRQRELMTLREGVWLVVLIRPLPVAHVSFRAFLCVFT